MTALLDTNVLVRHLSGDPPHQAERATRFLTGADELVFPDLIAAEVVYVMGSYYGHSRMDVARALRSLIAQPGIITSDRELLVRAFDLYESYPIGFADAYVVATAEMSGFGVVASFDKGIDRVGTVQRLEPA